MSQVLAAQPSAEQSEGRQAAAAANGGYADESGIRGLTFERRWTKPGVHPYDELEWETRPAS